MTARGSCMGYMSSTQLHESFMKFLLSKLETSWGPLLANSTTATAPKLLNQVQHAPFFCFLLTWWSKAVYINQPLWIPSSFCIASLPQAESIVHISSCIDARMTSYELLYSRSVECKTNYRDSAAIWMGQTIRPSHQVPWGPVAPRRGRSQQIVSIHMTRDTPWLYFTPIMDRRNDRWVRYTYS